MTNNSERNILIINSDLRNLNDIRDFIYQYALSYTRKEEFSLKLSLAVDEVCSNLIKYAYKFNSKNFIKIRIEYLDHKIFVNIFDNGEKFNLMDYNSPTIQEYFSKIMKNGLGITIIKSIIDEIHYKTTDDYNCLTLVKVDK